MKADMLEMRFREVDGDMIAYLWNPQKGSDARGSVSVHRQSDFDLQVREVHEGSNRCRAIAVVGSKDAAMAYAQAERYNASAQCVITQIDDESWCVGTLAWNGNYDDGVPAIFDLREGAEPLNIHGDPEFFDIITNCYEAGPPIYDLDQDRIVSPAPEESSALEM